MNNTPSSTPQPSGMGGSHRQEDPSELEQDRVRRWWMHLAFVVLAAACVLGGFGVGQLLGLLAGLPLAILLKLGEMRLKVASGEFRLFIKELPSYRIVELAIWLGLAAAGIFKFPQAAAWMFMGGWLCDTVSYYRHRPERLRHLYAVVMAIDFFRDFRLPWIYPLPLLAWSLWPK